MKVKLIHKHSKIEMIMKLTRVNVRVNIFIVNISHLIYKGSKVHSFFFKNKLSF